MIEDGSLYSGWLAQPSPASLQPLSQWTAYPDYTSHEAVACPYTADMYVQPGCPSYTLVGTSSVLTYASQPLITNFAVSGHLPGRARPACACMGSMSCSGYFLNPLVCHSVGCEEPPYGTVGSACKITLFLEECNTQYPPVGMVAGW